MPGSATYSLVLTGANVASGLFALDAADTSAGDGDGIGQGAEIVLNQAGNVITGSAGATDYFTIEINPATGVVTFTAARRTTLAREHRRATTIPQTLTLANADLLQLVQTVTDADGDSDTAAINLGAGVFPIEDDGPDAVVVNATAAAIVLDETRRLGRRTATGVGGSATVTANFAGELCGGDGLRQRRCWQRDLFAGADRLERGVRAVCAGCGGHQCGRRRRDWPGRGDRAQPGPAT